jgi:hypothetical protein
MKRHLPVKGASDPALLSAAADIVLSQGPPPEKDAGDDTLIQHLCVTFRPTPEHACRVAVIRARKLSRDAYDICDAFRGGAYGKGSEAADVAIRALEEKSPGFFADDYLQAFVAGLLWTVF